MPEIITTPPGGLGQPFAILLHIGGCPSPAGALSDRRPTGMKIPPPPSTPAPPGHPGPRLCSRKVPCVGSPSEQWVSNVCHHPRTHRGLDKTRVLRPTLRVSASLGLGRLLEKIAILLLLKDGKEDVTQGGTSIGPVAGRRGGAHSERHKESAGSQPRSRGLGKEGYSEETWWRGALAELTPRDRR